jgi:hypothetical protein
MLGQGAPVGSAMNDAGLGPLVFVISIVLVIVLFWYFSRDK